MAVKRDILLEKHNRIKSSNLQLLSDIPIRNYKAAVIAPDKEKSGVGHSFTYRHPILYVKLATGRLTGYFPLWMAGVIILESLLVSMTRLADKSYFMGIINE